MDAVLMFGWIAAAFVLSSFYLRNMASLRLAALASNAMFIIYAILASATPILVLHCLLLLLNLWRLLEMRMLRRRFIDAAPLDTSTERLLPFMRRGSCKRGAVIFNKGDTANDVYFILQGEVILSDSNKSVAGGQMLGLMGVCSSERRRVDSAICMSDVEYGAIAAERFWELVTEDSSFGYYIIRTIVDRQLMPDALKSRGMVLPTG